MTSKDIFNSKVTQSVTFIEGDVAYCSGEGTLGHPGVYLNLGESAEVTCPYCSRVFKNKI